MQAYDSVYELVPRGKTSYENWRRWEWNMPSKWRRIWAGSYSLLDSLKLASPIASKTLNFIGSRINILFDSNYHHSEVVGGSKAIV